MATYDQTTADLELLVGRRTAKGLGLLTDANAVHAAIEEFKKLKRTRFLRKYGYKKSTQFLIFDGRDHFDSKAIVGAAVGHQHPKRGALKHNEFSGGEVTVVKKLERLGFKVIEQGPGVDWTPEENAAIVAVYFDMLGIVARDEKLNKAAHNAALRERLQRRTRGSIERKFMNVTAALAEMSKPTLDGYAPNANIQDDLTPAIEEYVAKNSTVVEMIFQDLESSPDTIDENFDKAESLHLTQRSAASRRTRNQRSQSPRSSTLQGATKPTGSLAGRGKSGSFATRSTASPGLAGRTSLRKSNMSLRTRGDGLGYDIESFEEDGSPRRIEVKSTNAGASSPFMLSPNEVLRSLALGSSYRLYRVYSLRTRPKFFILTGSLERQLLLEACAYRARLRPIEADAVGIEEEED